MTEKSNALSESVRAIIQKELTRYETKQSSLLPILHAIQDEYRFVSEEQVALLEKDYGFPAVETREVLTFYSMYRTSPPAKYEILFCNNIVCSMMGADEAMEKIHKIIDECESKGLESPFSLQGVPCLGVCDGAPAMLVNKDRYLKVTDSSVDEILAKYK